MVGGKSGEIHTVVGIDTYDRPACPKQDIERQRLAMFVPRTRDVYGEVHRLCGEKEIADWLETLAGLGYVLKVSR